jgi:hypothetical protein
MLYVQGLDYLLDQVTNGLFEYDVAVSGCAMHSATKAALKKRYGNRIIYSWIDDIYTVNITHNKTVDEIVKRKGPYTGYIFVDSGVLTKFKTALLEIHNRAITEKYGIISMQTDTDMGLENWFGLPTGYVFRGQDFIVPVGKCVHIHFNYYPHKFYEYYGKTLPDIFKASCTESVFYYMIAPLKLKWCVVKDMVLTHYRSADGATSLEKFDPPTKPYWNELMFGIDIRDKLSDPRAKATGFGYDEWAHIFDHNPAAYDSDGMALDPEGLGAFVKEAVFIPKHLFDYDTVKCEVII